MPGQLVAHRPLRVNPQHLGGSRIEVTDFPIPPGYNDAFLNGVEERFEKTLFPRKFQHETLQALRVHPVNAPDQFVEKSTLHGVTQCVTQWRAFCGLSRQNMKKIAPPNRHSLPLNQ